MNKQMRVLGVDLGLQRTGLAISDALGISVRALETIKPGNRQHDFEYLMKICIKEEVHAITFGIPMRAHQDFPNLESQNKNTIGERAVKFAQFIKDHLPEELADLQIFLVDESRSSIEASQRLVTSNVPKKKRKEFLDSEAARIIVERFLSGCPHIEIKKTLE